MNADASDALFDALVALCQQLGGLVNADLSEVKAQGGLHVLSLLQELTKRSTDNELSRLRVENARLAKELTGHRQAEQHVFVRLHQAEAQVRAQQFVIDAAAQADEDRAAARSRRAAAASGSSGSTLVRTHQPHQAPSLTGGGGPKSRCVQCGHLYEGGHATLGGQQRAELVTLRRQLVELERGEAGKVKVEARLKEAHEQLANLRVSLPAKRSDELASRAFRAESQLQAARGALFAAEAARVKVKRIATHRDEMEQATRKELLELQARHRALQAAMRDREAQRFAGSDLAKAAEGTPSYAA
eukprot:scaffold128891_cov63-Phaeocystis_antarctica.AAC.1